MPQAAEICPKCGVRQRKPVSKAALLLLTFFFGGIGAHKFYLGKNWQGVLYLLFCITGIPGLIAFIEFIIYAFTSSESLNEKYSAEGSVAVIVIVVVFAGIFFIGILAAVSIPAYQDYTVRAKVQGGLAAASSLQRSVEGYYLANQKLPAAPTDVGSGAAETGDAFGRASLGADGVVTLTLTPSAGAQLAGTTVVFQPRIDGGTLRWDCTGGTLAPRYRPISCRTPR
jgi:TM2 domain-containing membrane protein YozV